MPGDVIINIPDFLALGDGVYTEIFDKLPLADVAHMRQTSKFFKNFVDDTYPNFRKMTLVYKDLVNAFEETQDDLVHASGRKFPNWANITTLTSALTAAVFSEFLLAMFLLGFLSSCLSYHEPFCTAFGGTIVSTGVNFGLILAFGIPLIIQIRQVSMAQNKLLRLANISETEMDDLSYDYPPSTCFPCKPCFQRAFDDWDKACTREFARAKKSPVSYIKELIQDHRKPIRNIIFNKLSEVLCNQGLQFFSPDQVLYHPKR